VNLTAALEVGDLSSTSGRNRKTVESNHVVHEQLPLGLLGDISSAGKDIHGIGETVSMGDIGTVQPTAVSEFIDGIGQQLLVHLEAKIDLPANG
jgi:hypothetical protein